MTRRHPAHRRGPEPFRRCECPLCRDMRELRRLHPELRETSMEAFHDFGAAVREFRSRLTVALSNLILRVRRGKGTDQ